MKFVFPLELSETPQRVAWHPVIPEGILEGYKGQRVSVSSEYLQNAVDETKRFYQDQQSRTGAVVHRPILFNTHADADAALKSGRKSGSLLDFAVREYKGKETLFVKGSWTEEAWSAMSSGALEHGSINIKPSYTDPQTGETYAPFINEFSETVNPVIKDFHLAETLDPASVGLSLAEGGNIMELEEVLAALTGLTEAVGAIGIGLEELTARVLALEPDEGAEDDEGAAEEGAAVAAEAAATEVAASEVSAELAALRADIAKIVRVQNLNTVEVGTPGSGVDVKLSEAEGNARTLAKVKAEGFSGYSAVKETKRRLEVS